MKLRVLHVTSVHPRGDVRILVKECHTLGRTELYEVGLAVMDGKGDDVGGPVGIFDVGPPGRSRFARVVLGNVRMLRAAWRFRATIVHLHDPELIPFAVLARLCRKRTVYDVHEDLPRQILGKAWIPGPLRRVTSALVGAVEWMAGKVVNGVVAATPTIGARFPPTKTVVVRNFPDLEDIGDTSEVGPTAEPRFLYIGGVAEVRGAVQMVRAIERLPDRQVRLDIAGEPSPAGFLEVLESEPGWNRVDYHGFIDREGIRSLLAHATAGLVLLHPIQNYLEAYPVKMFEYMAAGLPVIASDFALWRGIVEDASCGLLVDPLDPSAIAEAMDWVLRHPAEAEAMGRAGREAVERRYNWDAEAQRLVNLYQQIAA